MPIVGNFKLRKMKKEIFFAPQLVKFQKREMMDENEWLKEEELENRKG